MEKKPKLYLLGWLGGIGGASTKNIDLIRLLRRDFYITFVPCCDDWALAVDSQDLLGRLGIDFCRFDDLSLLPGETVLVVCYDEFFSSGRALHLKERGARIVWSNEMMWAFDGEAEAARDGLIDKALFLSSAQERLLRDIYAGTERLVVGNYVAMERFPFRERTKGRHSIGRLSRAVTEKYSVDFPAFYEELNLANVRYRIMAWSAELTKHFGWHHFGPQWELLGPQAVDRADFLASLDLYVYSFSPLFRESWGRSVVEAMLTGCPVLVPSEDSFPEVLLQNEGGFLCSDFEDYRSHATALWSDDSIFLKCSRAAAEFARDVHSNETRHRDIWLNALAV